LPEHDRPHEETETHGATPPHGDPLTPEHPQTGGRHPHADPETEENSPSPPQGDPLEPPAA
jgi:hypothetical protein